MKGKDLNKRLRELRHINKKPKPGYVFAQGYRGGWCTADGVKEILYPGIEEHKFKWEPFRQQKGVVSCKECKGINVLNVMEEDSPTHWAGWLCQDCNKIVEIETKPTNM